MNKKIIYAVLLALVFGGITFYQYQVFESKLESKPYYNSQELKKDGDYLDSLFSEKYYNEKQPANPFAELAKGSTLLFRFVNQDSTLYYRILEDSPANLAEVSVEVYELNIKFNNDESFAPLLEAENLVEIIGGGNRTTFGKQEITETANACNVKMGSIIELREYEKSWLLDWEYSPIGTLMGLLFFSILIWWSRHFSVFFGRLIGVSEGVILSIFVTLFTLLPILTYSRYLERVLNSADILKDLVYSLYGWYSLLPIGLFVVFRVLLSLTKNRYDFADLEAGKFLFITLVYGLFIFFRNYFHEVSFGDISSFPTEADYAIIQSLLLATANFLNNFRAHYYELRRQGKKLKRVVVKDQSSQSELQSLQSRVNPHFLYNSLNSIASLATVNPEKTEKMAMALSNFYKYNTNRQDEIWTTVGEEMEMVRTYLDIEKIRFEDQLDININVSKDCKDYKIPRFIIQPLVENAVKYGYNEKTGKINITVSAIYSTKAKSLDITIEDGGQPFTEDLDAGYGFNSVQKKLKLAFPDNHHFGFINSPKKSVNITIKNPEVYA